MMYSMSVRVSTETRGGKKTLTDFDVNAGGYMDERSIEDAKVSYNASKDMPEVKYEGGDWRKERFAHLYNGMKRMRSIVKKRKNLS